MNQTVKLWIVYISAVTLFVSSVRPADAVVATEFTQVLNNIQLVISVQKQVEMIYNQTLMLQNQLESLKKYKNGEWGDVMGVIRDLDRVIRQGQALSYSIQNIEAEFKRKFPGYNAPVDYVASYQGWSQTTLETIQNSLVSAGMQRKDFESETSLLKRLNALSDNAAGQTQAIQAGNLIANQSVNQIILLRQLMMDNLNAQVSYMAFEVNKQSADQAVANNLFKEIPYEKGKGMRF